MSYWERCAMCFSFNEKKIKKICHIERDAQCASLLMREMRNMSLFFLREMRNMFLLYAISHTEREPQHLSLSFREMRSISLLCANWERCAIPLLYAIMKEIEDKRHILSLYFDFAYRRGIAHLFQYAHKRVIFRISLKKRERYGGSLSIWEIVYNRGILRISFNVRIKERYFALLMREMCLLSAISHIERDLQDLSLFLKEIRKVSLFYAISDGVATFSRLLTIIDLCCRISSLI